MTTFFFFGLSPIIKPSVIWLEENAVPFYIITDSKQSDQAWPGLSQERVRTLESLDAFNLLSFKTQGNAIGFSVGSPWRFSDQFIQTVFPDALFNLHGTPLPQHRGGNIYSWFVLHGVRTGIALLHRLTPGIDEGAVMRYEEFLYPVGCKKPIDYIGYYEKENGRFLLGIIKDVKSGKIGSGGFAQPEYLSTYLPRLSSEINGWISWELEGTLLDRFISAFDEPYSGARTMWRRKEVIVKDVYFQPGFHHHPFEYGNVLRKNDRWLSVAVTGGELIVCSVTDVKNNNLYKHIQCGDRFSTPSENLDCSRQRIVKGKDGLQPQKPH